MILSDLQDAFQSTDWGNVADWFTVLVSITSVVLLFITFRDQRRLIGKQITSFHEQSSLYNYQTEAFERDKSLSALMVRPVIQMHAANDTNRLIFKFTIFGNYPAYNIHISSMTGGDIEWLGNFTSVFPGQTVECQIYTGKIKFYTSGYLWVDDITGVKHTLEWRAPDCEESFSFLRYTGHKEQSNFN